MIDGPTPTDRMLAAEATIQEFAGKPFQWGERDCLRMIAFSLRQLGRTPPLRQAGAYRTLIGAHRALKRTGFATLDAWVDAWGLQRIPPAYALPADILALPSDYPTLPAMGLQLSNGRFLCYVAATGTAECASFAAADRPLTAWRV